MYNVLDSPPTVVDYHFTILFFAAAIIDSIFLVRLLDIPMPRLNCSFLFAGLLIRCRQNQVSGFFKYLCFIGTSQCLQVTNASATE